MSNSSLDSLLGGDRLSFYRLSCKPSDTTARESSTIYTFFIPCHLSLDFWPFTWCLVIGWENCRRFLFPLILLLSSCQLVKVKTSLFKWRHYHILLLKMMIFSPNTYFWTKKVSIDDFFMTTWEREKECRRKKGTTNSEP